jgi:DNA-3-methyladenine glycosylase II
LSQKVQDGTVRLARIGRLSDDQIIDELCQINGIGRWTAQMFLIFALGREDVFPSDDFGVRMAIMKLYGYDDVPSREQLAVIGERWSPFASVGAWYCWRYLDLIRAEKNLATPKLA